MKIKRLRAENFRGLVELDTVIGDHGSIAYGENATGKTSTVKALWAALVARDIGADAIRIGTERAEILVDMDHHTVRRTITRDGSKITVISDEGDRKMKPTQWLAELFGSMLDPLSLFLAAPKDRRAIVLAAVPMSITAEDLRAYAPDLDPKTDTSGHALEVIERIRQRYYDRRTESNAIAAQRRADFEAAKKLADEAGKLADERYADRPALEAAELAARAALTDLTTRATAAAAAGERSAKSRERIVVLRERASTIRGQADTPDQAAITELTERLAIAAKEVERLKAELAAAVVVVNGVGAHLDAALEAEKRWIAARASADTIDAQADDLDAAVAAVAGDAIGDEQIAAAQAVALAAKDDLVCADLWAAYRRRLDVADAAERVAAEAKRIADALNVTVKRLTDDAPRELFARGNLIEGLALVGNDVMLGGVSMDGLCGAEQLRFAVDVAKRASAKGKVIIVDGLERLDDKQLARLVEFVAADGFQLIGSRVRNEVRDAAGNIVVSGEFSIEAIEPSVAETVTT